jgi:outer membrane protein assembly factor BamD
MGMSNRTYRSLFFSLCGLGLLLFFSGCSTWDSVTNWLSPSPKKELEKTPESLIQEGMDAYQRRKFEAAIEAFQKVKDRFPYHQYAILAELKLADSYFLNKDYELAVTAYKEFEKLHPANEIIPYVVFQQGMCYFKQMPTIDRDQSKTELAVQEFDRLLKTYPQSEYAAEAQKNRTASRNNLVQHEFYVGEYYFKNKNCPAALGRFEGILQKYPDVAPPKKMESYLQTCREKLASSK